MARKLFKKNINFGEVEKTILVKNTSIEVHPYKLGDAPNIEHSLCVWNDVYFKAEMVGMDYNEETKTLYVPRTASVGYLEKMMGVDAKKYGKSDPSKSINVKLKLRPRDDVQREALNFLMSRGKYGSNMYYSRLMLSLDTGKGKTFCAIAAIVEMKKRAAIIVPDKTLMERWEEGITECTDLHAKYDVYHIKGHESIDKVLNGHEIREPLVLISHRTITNYALNNGWSTITKLFKKLKIGIKVYDEAHKEFKNIVKIDLHTNTEKTIYLTATAERSSIKENIIYSNIFLKMPQLVIRSESREENHINMAILTYDSCPSTKDIYLCKGRKGFSATSFMKYNMDKGQTHFLRAIDVFMNSVKDKEGRILIMVGLIDMIFYLEGYLKNTYPELANDIGIYCSKVSDAEKKHVRKNKRIILTTSKSLGTGADIDGLTFICMAEPYSSKVTAQQCSGRLRNKGWYFELVDEGFSDCKRQFNMRKKQLIRKSNKFKIIKI